MSKKIKNSNVAEVSSNNEVVTETPKTVETVIDNKPKVTPVEDRKYELTDAGREFDKAFRGKQRQIVFNVLKAATEPMTYTEVAREAEKLELKAVGGIDLSCRYHLHHLALDGFAIVTNPSTDLAADPTISE